MARSTILILVLVFEAALVGLALLLYRPLGVEPNPLRLVHATWRTTLVGLLCGTVLFIAVAASLRLEWSPIASLRNDIEVVVTEVFGNSRLIDFVFISAAAGIGEEILFRGVMQPGLLACWGVAAGLIITSLVFGFIHYVSFAYAVYASVIGAVFGVLVIAFGNLWTPIVAHATYDCVALVVLTRDATRVFGASPAG